MLTPYRKGQGKWSRLIAAGVVMALVIFGCWTLYEWLMGYKSVRTLVIFSVPGIDLNVNLAFLISAVVFVVFAVLTYYFVALHRRTCNFLIETEVEMKKVTWPSGSDVAGSTLIVVITVIVFAAWALLCDFVFSNLIGFIYGR